MRLRSNDQLPLGHDYREASILGRNEDAYALLVRMGLAHALPKKARRRGKLPPNLSQRVVTNERELFKTPAKMFKGGHRKGYDVCFVTLVRRTWAVPKDRLTSDLFIRARNEMTRALRRIGSEARYRALGIVDISFNVGVENVPPHWQVHGHIFVVVKTKKGMSKAIIRRALAHRDDAPNALNISVLQSTDDIIRTREYISSKLYLSCQQRRCSFIKSNGTRDTKKRPLRSAQERELAKVLLELGPRPRWILSGLVRHGSEIKRLRQTRKLAPRRPPAAWGEVMKIGRPSGSGRRHQQD